MDGTDNKSLEKISYHYTILSKDPDGHFRIVKEWEQTSLPRYKMQNVADRGDRVMKRKDRVIVTQHGGHFDGVVEVYEQVTEAQYRLI